MPGLPAIGCFTTRIPARRPYAVVFDCPTEPDRRWYGYVVVNDPYHRMPLNGVGCLSDYPRPPLMLVHVVAKLELVLTFAEPP